MVFVLELLGTIAFAISGASIGIQKKMDIFGVSILAMTTAVGGGIIRDIILNITPPAAFRNPVFTFTSIATGIIVSTLSAIITISIKSPLEKSCFVLWTQ